MQVPGPLSAETSSPTSSLIKPCPFANPTTETNNLRDGVAYLEQLTGFNCDAKLHSQVTDALTYWSNLKDDKTTYRIPLCSKINELADKVLMKPKAVLKLSDGDFPLTRLVLRQFLLHSQTIRSKLERWNLKECPLIDFSIEGYNFTSSAIDELLKSLKDKNYSIPYDVLFETYAASNALAVESLQSQIEAAFAAHLDSASPIKRAFDCYLLATRQVTLSSNTIKTLALIRMAEFLTDKNSRNLWKYKDGRLEIASLEVDWKEVDLDAFVEACTSICNLSQSSHGSKFFSKVCSLPKEVELYLTHLFHSSRKEFDESNIALSQLIKISPFRDIKLRICDAINMHLIRSREIFPDLIEEVRGFYFAEIFSKFTTSSLLKSFYVFVSTQDGEIFRGWKECSLRATEGKDPIFSSMHFLCAYFFEENQRTEAIESGFEKIFKQDKTNLPAIVLLNKYIRTRPQISEKQIELVYYAYVNTCFEFPNAIIFSLIQYLDKNHPYAIEMYHAVGKRHYLAKQQQSL